MLLGSTEEMDAGGIDGHSLSVALAAYWIIRYARLAAQAAQSREAYLRSPQCLQLASSGQLASGSVKQIRVPVRASASQILPPWASTIVRAIARPRPLPELVRAASLPPR